MTKHALGRQSGWQQNLWTEVPAQPPCSATEECDQSWPAGPLAGQHSPGRLGGVSAAERSPENFSGGVTRAQASFFPPRCGEAVPWADSRPHLGTGSFLMTSPLLPRFIGLSPAWMGIVLCSVPASAPTLP